MTSKSLAPIDEIQHALMSGKKQFAAALPKQINPDKFLRVALTAINSTPELAKCERRSLYNAFMNAAQDGLLPDKREGAIVTFKDQAVWMPMVGGLLKKIRNSGELKSITAQIVYKNEPFQHWVDEKGEHILHRPMLEGDRGAMVAVYALAITKDEGVYIEVMSREDIEKVRSISRSRDGGPWKSWYEEMAKKTAIRRLSKRLPMSTDLETVLERDNELYDVEQERAADAPPAEEKPKQAKRTRKIVEGAVVKQEQPRAEAHGEDPNTALDSEANDGGGQEPLESPI